MSEKYPGGFVTYNPPTPSQTSATGIWTLSQQEQYQQAGLWPNSPSQVSRSLRFNQADSTSLSRTPTYSGNLKTWTWSAWVKRTNLSDYQYNLFGASVTSANYDEFRFNTSDQFRFFMVSSSSVVLDLITTQVFRDPSAWYHLVVAYDSTQATSSNRAKLYVNGVQVTSFATATYPSQNQNTTINSNALTRIGLSQSGFLLNCYMANVQFVDGQALDPTSFGEYNVNTGVWQPLQKNLTYGTNGFQLTFNDNTNTTATTLGADSSGNGNNFTPSNFSVTAGAGNDSMVDSPTSYGTDTGVGGTVRGNYCTLNPLDKESSITLANGNLDVTASGTWVSVRSTFGMTSGKWYWETTFNGFQIMIGIGTSAATLSNYIGSDTNGWAYYFGGQKYTNSTATAYGASYTTGDIIGIAFDADTGSLTFYKNGTSQGVAFTGLTSGPYFPALGLNNATPNINFGQRPFAYTAPSGFKALCTQNLPTPTIGATTATQAGAYFTPSLFAGAASANITVSGLAFQPSLIWFKSRSAAENNIVIDAVRGGTKNLITNSTAAEGTAGTALTFNADGYTVPAGYLTNGATYVGWSWSGAGSGSTNTAGSITSTVSANTTSGFSVVTYTNASSGTVGHGLGVAPAMVIYKDRTNVTNWVVLHQSLANMSNSYLTLNTTNAVASGISLGGNPTSSVIYTNTNIIQNGAASVAYCFAEVAGYSKFGSYTGNGSTDGPFVFTGFRPAYVMFKRTDVANDWVINDATRSAYNQTINVLYANDSAAENTTGAGNSIDILSNGFKLRQTNNGSNASGGTYIFMAFATSPFKYSLAR